MPRQQIMQQQHQVNEIDEPINSPDSVRNPYSPQKPKPNQRHIKPRPKQPPSSFARDTYKENRRHHGQQHQHASNEKSIKLSDLARSSEPLGEKNPSNFYANPQKSRSFTKSINLRSRNRRESARSINLNSARSKDTYKTQNSTDSRAKGSFGSCNKCSVSLKQDAETRFENKK